jgi:hypothetical protein
LCFADSRDVAVGLAARLPPRLGRSLLHVWLASILCDEVGYADGGRRVHHILDVRADRFAVRDAGLAWLLRLRDVGVVGVREDAASHSAPLLVSQLPANKLRRDLLSVSCFAGLRKDINSTYKS